MLVEDGTLGLYCGPDAFDLEPDEAGDYGVVARYAGGGGVTGIMESVEEVTSTTDRPPANWCRIRASHHRTDHHYRGSRGD